MRQAIFVFGMVIAARALALADDKACLECHSTLRARLASELKHGALESGCETCHTDHTPSSAAKAAMPYLVANPPELCANCHDLAETKLRDAHRGQPFAKARCTRCHDPHASKNQKLIAATPHEPFAKRQCESCHVAAVNGVAKLKAETSAVCLGCHQNQKPHGGSCVECHEPHASNRKFLMASPGASLCSRCHAAVAKKEFVHEPAKSDCTLCHNPHGGLRAEGNALCLECHSVDSKSKLEAPDRLTLFGGQITLPAQHFRDLKLLELTNDRGHPVANHPVLSKADGKTSALSCLTCHNPHGADNSAPMLVTESPTMTSLCQRCHK
jgi:predicted CXXCH cytochrome family protein